MNPGLKWSVYGATAVLVITGLCYAVPYYLDDWFFIEVPMPVAASTLMAVHGLAAMIIGVVLGMVWQGHSRKKLVAGGKGKRTGVGLLSFMMALAVSGYLLYYGSGEALRSVAADLHTLAGSIMPLALIFHRCTRLVSKKSTVEQPGGKRTADEECGGTGGGLPAESAT